MISHPLLSGVCATVAGFAIAAWILRYEFRHQLRQRRRRGYLAGGPR